MNVTVICDVLGEENNGTTVAAMNLVRSLKEKGHSVNIVCCDKSKIGQEGYYVCPVRSFGVFNNYIQKVGVALAKPDYEVMRSAIVNADIVHCMLPFALTRAAIKLAKELHKPITAGFHCQAENVTNHLFLKNSKLASLLTYKYFYSKVYSKVDCIHYPSQFIRDVFERAISHYTNGVVISNGVADGFAPERRDKPPSLKDKFIILSIGRYSHEKCQKVLIKAVGQSKHKDDIVLVLAGKGALQRKYEALGEKYGIDLQLRFFDRQHLQEVIGYTDLYVHPADIELEGIAALEAVKSGLPVIMSDSKRSATRLLARDERNLFSEHDSSDLAAKIDYWIEHEEQRLECAEYYAKNTDVPSTSECMDKMENMLFATLASTKGVVASEKRVRQLPENNRV